MVVLQRLMLATLILALLTSPVLTLAQDDDEVVWVEYEGDNDLVVFSFPEGWFVSTGGNTPSGFIFANNEDLLERIENTDDTDDAAVEGDKGGFVIALPSELLAFLGVTLTDETTPEELVISVGGFLFADDEDAVLELGEPEVVELEDQDPISVIPFTEGTDNIEGIIFGYIKDGVLITGFVVATISEFDEEFRDLAIESVLSFELTIDAGELLELMGG